MAQDINGIGRGAAPLRTGSSVPNRQDERATDGATGSSTPGVGPDRVSLTSASETIRAAESIARDAPGVDAERVAYALVDLEEMGLEEPGLDRLIRAGYDLLDLQTYFTAGPKEARAWTIRRGTTAPQAAGVIHGDFEKGFIRAETIAYDDYVALGGETPAKEAGKMRAEGKAYVVKDGDVMHFLFNT